MILSDKIINLRKRMGWSQEELAEKLSVSRQSVSKWELGAAIPDLDKVIKLADLFGVSTDYLLKDEKETVEYSDGREDEYETVHKISIDDAVKFMDISKKSGRMIALAVTLFILAPVALIVLAGGSDALAVPFISQKLAVIIGLTTLFAFIASGVAICIYHGTKIEKYEFLEKEQISLEYGVSGIVQKRKNEYEDTYRLGIIAGIVCCVLCPVPLIITAVANEGGSNFPVVCCVGVLLAIVAAGVYVMIRVSFIWESFNKLLQEEDFTVEKKEENKDTSPAAGIYWCLAVAVFLVWSFTTNDWSHSWIVWPIAGVIFVPFQAIVSAVKKKTK